MRHKDGGGNRRDSHASLAVAATNPENPVTESGIQSLQVVLCDEIFAGRISVRLEPFVQFNATVDAGLSELVAKWQRPLPLIAQRGPGKRTRNRKPK